MLLLGPWLQKLREARERGRPDRSDTPSGYKDIPFSHNVSFAVGRSTKPTFLFQAPRSRQTANVYSSFTSLCTQFGSNPRSLGVCVCKQIACVLCRRLWHMQAEPWVYRLMRMAQCLLLASTLYLQFVGCSRRSRNGEVDLVRAWGICWSHRLYQG